jgi:hypothetical protein
MTPLSSAMYDHVEYLQEQLAAIGGVSDIAPEIPGELISIWATHTLNTSSLEPKEIVEALGNLAEREDDFASDYLAAMDDMSESCQMI